jgi:hypothetical protein
MSRWNEASYRFDFYVLCVIFIFFLAPALFIIYRIDFNIINGVTRWIDPTFFLYNFVLLLVAILMVPFVTFNYVHNMKNEKKNRLLNELTENEKKQYNDYIDKKLSENIKFSAYFGSTITIMISIALGLSIILFLKPAFDTSEPADGVDYSKGANFLLMGPFIEMYITDKKETLHHVIVGLTAFQFGFLGAYIYFISTLVRSYFTLDLSPNTYIDSAVRMAIGSVLALVLSFILPLLPFFEGEQGDALFLRCLPVVAFFIGFFPNRGLMVVEKFGTRVLNLTRSGYNALSLSELSGMSYAYEVRLQREGFDNLENLVHAKPLDLALRTGINFRQLEHWIGQAWLRLHLGNHYAKFEENTGITSREEFKEYFSGKDLASAIKQLDSCLCSKILNKVENIYVLLH